jgi:hypothetical protein
MRLLLTKENKPQHQETKQHRDPRRRIGIPHLIFEIAQKVPESRGTAAGQCAVFDQSLRNQHIEAPLRNVIGTFLDVADGG